ncbi:MAG: WD40 repeat domain-containing serine/threonine-protein kinase, partial [Planctomycetota bacterium]
MLGPEGVQQLLFADVALTLGVVDAERAATALQRYREEESDDRRPIADALEAVAALSAEDRARVQAEVDRLVDEADGDFDAALARRGGIDRSIHASLSPEASKALLKEGAGARAPLRVVDEERYTDFTVVGKGGMGVVYLTLDTELNRRVAFKLVRPDPHAPKEAPAPDTPLRLMPPSQVEDVEESRSFQELKIRFLQEAWVTGAMEHPGVVPVYELGTTETGIPYYTMRYFKGERTLATAIEAARDLDARLALLEPFLKVCDAVRYAHARGVLHRDLKPENVALGEFGEAVVLDWGLSKMEARPDVAGSRWRSRIEEFRDATDLHTVAGALGTPGYMAPEAVLGRSEGVDERSDVYSLGAILFQILTGRLPHRFKTFTEFAQRVLDEDPPPAHEVAEGVPPELSELCARALARPKEDRFESVDELAGAVRRWQTEGRLTQQINELVDAARRELQAAQETSGSTKLWHIDRAMAACTRVLHLKKDHRVASALRSEIKKLRAVGIKERVSSSRRKAVLAVGFLILAVAALVTVGIAGTYAKDLRDAEEQLAESVLEVRSARKEREGAIQGRADLYAGLGSHLLKRDWVAEARLAAAKAVTVAPSRQAWRALAAAESRWTPTLVAVPTGLVPGPVAFTNDGKHVLVCASNCVREYDLAAHKVRRTYPVEGARLLAVSPSGGRLATVDRAGLVHIWDTDDGTLMTVLSKDRLPEDFHDRHAPQIIRAIVFSRDGQTLYTGHYNAGLVQWNLATGTCSAHRHGGRGAASVSAIQESADGRFLYVGDISGAVRQCSTADFDSQTVIDTGSADVLHVVGTPDGDMIYACSLDRRVSIVELDPVRVFTGCRLPPGCDLASAVLLRDLRHVCSVDVEGVTSIYDQADKKRLARLQGRAGKVGGLAVSPDGARIAVSQGTLACVWALRPEGRPEEREPITALVRSPDRKRAWVARPDFDIELWDAAKERTLARWRAHTATITALAAEGERVFSASLDGTLAIWPAQGKKAITSFRGPVAPTALAIGEHGAACTGSIDGSVEIWSTRRRRRVALFQYGGELPVVALAVRGKELHSWDVSGAHRAWDTQSRDRIESAGLDLPMPAMPRTDLPPME